jgi:adenosylcobinamide kinase / adenosylcobinamide-phosphate guanylyltransferase
MLVMITGGARSGKSRFAERYAACLGERGYYIATSRIWDEEMRERVEMHRMDRDSSGFRWETVEEPVELPERLAQLDGMTGEAEGSAITGTTSNGESSAVILVDCLTLWLTNVLLAAENSDWTGGETRDRAVRAVNAHVDRLISTLRSLETPLLLVTNEVGDGIVPEYPLGRLFRDLAGKMNQRLAAECDQVFLVTAGIPVELKQQAFQLPPKYAAGNGMNRKG